MAVETRHLEERIAALEARVAALERSELEPLPDTDPNWPEDCRDRQCDYYRFYLRSGPPELTHADYHWTLQQYTETLDRIERCYDEGHRRHSSLEALALIYERRLRV